MKVSNAEPPNRPGPPYNPQLRKLVEGKRKWHRPEYRVSQTGLGQNASENAVFPGWHECGYLPHFDAPYVTQFVTFMLHDAFPVARRPEWESMLNEPDDSLRRRKVEARIDRGHGDCSLRQPRLASLVEEKLLENDGKTFRLRVWTLMPNHVHLVVDVWATPLLTLLRLWKGASARAANQILGRTGPFWEREYFDTLIRDAEHLKKAVRYTEQNPVKAGLVAERKAWRWGSARLRDEYDRLVWEKEVAP
ncbi:MAG TPA: transposase [Verrucomicrobiae bacterium]|nr:transposase [Verrucomicrobiae bacterium]